MSLDDLLLQYIYDLSEPHRYARFSFAEMTTITRKNIGRPDPRHRIPDLFLVNRHLLASFLRICGPTLLITVSAWAGSPLRDVPLFSPLQYFALTENITSLNVFMEFGYMCKTPFNRETPFMFESYIISIPKMFPQLQSLAAAAKHLSVVNIALHSYEFRVNEDVKYGDPGSLSHILALIGQVCTPIKNHTEFELNVSLLRCSPYTRPGLKYSFEKEGFELPLQVNGDWTLSMALCQRWNCRSVDASSEEHQIIKRLFGQSEVPRSLKALT